MTNSVNDSPKVGELWFCTADTQYSCKNWLILICSLSSDDYYTPPKEGYEIMVLNIEKDQGSPRGFISKKVLLEKAKLFASPKP